jgi:hypothetical protein
VRRWAILSLGLVASCGGGPVLVALEGPVFVPDEVNAITLDITGTGNSDPVRVRQEFILEGERRPLSETVEVFQGDALDDDVEIVAVALLGTTRVASGAVVYDLDDGGEVTLRLTRWAEAGCDDPDGDQRGDGPACLDFDCDESDPDVHPTAAEVCNGVDDDCDLSIDEGCACVDGLVVECGVSEGVCSASIQVCADGAWLPCELASHLRRDEVCDGRDNDCDGSRDEGCL